MIGGKPAVEARVGLLPAEADGLHSPMPTGTRSLLLAFPSLERADAEVKIGAMIDVLDGPALVPGTDEVQVIIRFWGRRGSGLCDAWCGVHAVVWPSRLSDLPAAHGCDCALRTAPGPDLSGRYVLSCFNSESAHPIDPGGIKNDFNCEQEVSQRLGIAELN